MARAKASASFLSLQGEHCHRQLELDGEEDSVLREALELGRDIVFLDLGKAVLSTGTVSTKGQPNTGPVNTISVQSSPNLPNNHVSPDCSIPASLAAALLFTLTCTNDQLGQRDSLTLRFPQSQLSTLSVCKTVRTFVAEAH